MSSPLMTGGIMSGPGGGTPYARLIPVAYTFHSESSIHT